MRFLKGKHRGQRLAQHAGVCGFFPQDLVAVQPVVEAVVRSPHQAVLVHPWGGASECPEQDGLGFLGFTHHGLAPVVGHGAVAVLEFVGVESLVGVIDGEAQTRRVLRRQRNPRAVDFIPALEFVDRHLLGQGVCGQHQLHARLVEHRHALHDWGFRCVRVLERHFDQVGGGCLAFSTDRQHPVLHGHIQGSAFVHGGLGGARQCVQAHPIAPAFADLRDELVHVACDAHGIAPGQQRPVGAGHLVGLQEDRAHAIPCTRRVGHAVVVDAIVGGHLVALLLGRRQGRGDDKVEGVGVVDGSYDGPAAVAQTFVHNVSKRFLGRFKIPMHVGQSVGNVDV